MGGNKVFATALFITVVSLINMIFGGGITSGQNEAVVPAHRVLGGPVSSMEGTAAMAGYGADEEQFTDTIFTHDASVSSPGQLVVRDAHDSLATIIRGFSIPARGINWGTLHPHNAVDIAGRCGSLVYTASAGQVIASQEGGWNSGYGNFVDIDHGNGISTRYAHIERNLVKVGQMVAGGDAIARMGNTGDSTGCHVHFEVRGIAGAPNPFAGK